MDRGTLGVRQTATATIVANKESFSVAPELAVIRVPDCDLLSSEIVFIYSPRRVRNLSGKRGKRPPMGGL